MCAMTDIVMCGEDAAETERKKSNYINILGASGEVEADQATLAAAYMVKCVRCLNADPGGGDGRAADVPRQRALARELETLRLIELLDTQPAAALVQLREISNGLTWLLEQTERLEDYLRYKTGLHPSDRLMALKIFGRRPQDLFIDQFILTFNLHAISGCHGDPSRLTPRELACILQADRPRDVPEGEFERRLADVQHWLTTNPTEAQKAVREVLAQFREKLESQLRLVTLREERDDLRAQADAAGTPTKESVLRLRYLRESDRGCQGALRELRRLQEWRLKHGEELGMQAPADTATEKAPETGPETPPEEAPAGSGEAVSRTEAAAPEVVGGSSSCDEVFGDDGAARRVSPGLIEPAIARGTTAHGAAPQKPPPPW
jgi:hypothetical protein